MSCRPPVFYYVDMKPKENIRLLYIDLFCGAGGTSTGVEDARVDGAKVAKVIACVNHDANAIESHRANHPETLHFTEDIRTLELSPMVTHLAKCREQYPDALVVLWASCECTSFSRAKGGMSRDADSRTLAEHLFRYVEALSPDIIQIENVDEFQTWGPLIEKRRRDGSVVMVKKSSGKGKDKVSWEEPAMLPDPEHKGEYYERWIRNMCSYGYRYESCLMNSADYGAYTSRRRFFGMFARPGIAIAFPQATHAKHPEPELFGPNIHKWKPVSDVLDFSDEGQSIFDREKPLVEATLKRILAGLQKFVGNKTETFLVKYNGMKEGRYTPPSMEEPCPTVATQNRLAVATANFLTKAYSGNPSEKNIGCDVPAGTVTAKDHHQFITAYYNKGGIWPASEPVGKLTDRHRLSIAFLDNQYGNSLPSGIDQPCGTVTNIPKQRTVNVHFITNPYSYKSDGHSGDKPAPTVIARQDKCPLGLCEAKREGGLPSFIRRTEEGLDYEIYDTDSPTTRQIKEFMASHGVVDITMRMLRIRELKLIQGFPADYILCGTQEEQKKYLGNAVVPLVAKVWCEAVVNSLKEE